jgi:hypothetical protein
MFIGRGIELGILRKLLEKRIAHGVVLFVLVYLAKQRYKGIRENQLICGDGFDPRGSCESV